MKMNQVFMLAALALSSPAYGQLIGYGAGTIGGDGGKVCLATDQPALIACLQRPGPGTVQLSGTVAIDSPAGGNRATVTIPSDKTVQGPATLTSQGNTLRILGGSNIIIRRLSFHSTLTDHASCSAPRVPNDVLQCGIPILIQGNSRHVWIDHNTFNKCGEKCISIWSRQLPGDADVSYPDRITISNNRFLDSYYGPTTGVDPTIAILPPPTRITYYGNLFNRVFRRSPKAASGTWAHFFNNVVIRYGGAKSCSGETYGFGPSVSGGAQMRLENNVYIPWEGAAACKQAIDNEEYPGRGFGQVSTVGDILRSGAIAHANSQDELQVFSPEYAYSLLPTSRVQAYVTSHAGMTGQ